MLCAEARRQDGQLHALHRRRLRQAIGGTRVLRHACSPERRHRWWRPQPSREVVPAAACYHAWPKGLTRPVCRPTVRVRIATPTGARPVRDCGSSASLRGRNLRWYAVCVLLFFRLALDIWLSLDGTYNVQAPGMSAAILGYGLNPRESLRSSRGLGENITMMRKEAPAHRVETTSLQGVQPSLAVAGTRAVGTKKKRK